MHFVPLGNRKHLSSIFNGSINSASPNYLWEDTVIVKRRCLPRKWHQYALRINKELRNICRDREAENERAASDESGDEFREEVSL